MIIINDQVFPARTIPFPSIIFPSQDISQGSGNHTFSQQVRNQFSYLHCKLLSKNLEIGFFVDFPTSQAVRGTNPTLIPEPKRLDREECRLNLLNHVEELQVCLAFQ